MTIPPKSTLRYAPSMRSATRPARTGRDLGKGGDHLAPPFAPPLDRKARARRPLALEVPLCGARGDERLSPPRHEDVGAAAGAALVLDGHQPHDGVRAPVLAVAEEYHPIALDFHQGL